MDLEAGSAGGRDSHPSQVPLFVVSKAAVLHLSSKSDCLDAGSVMALSEDSLLDVVSASAVGTTVLLSESLVLSSLGLLPDSSSLLGDFCAGDVASEVA